MTWIDKCFIKKFIEIKKKTISEINELLVVFVLISLIDDFYLHLLREAYFI